jgi:curved DNA-binding protein CbpA
VLGLSPAATPQEVRDRYRALAKVHHPDVGGTTEACQRLLKAYEEARLAAGRGG